MESSQSHSSPPSSARAEDQQQPLMRTDNLFKAAFDIEPILRFAAQGTATVIRRPKEIAFFSFDEQHSYHADERSLRYYYPPSLGANLSKGFETFRQLDDSTDEHLDYLLKTLRGIKSEDESKNEPDFVAWRGMITKIMATPYDNMGGNGWEMNATLFKRRCKETIFIEENHSYKKQQQQEQQRRPSYHGAPPQDLMSYWGYKFETLCLLPDTWDHTSRDFIENRENAVVDNHAQYCSVVKTQIGNAKLILGGEVDAVWNCKPSNPSDPINWVELKTSAVIENERDMLKYERKLLKFWAQSFLLGVPKIIVGFRSKHGILQRLEEIETRSIPETVKKNGKTWDGNLCLNFTAIFLVFLKNTITEGGVWRIRRRNGASQIEVFRYQDEGFGHIIPDWYWRDAGEPEGISNESLEAGADITPNMVAQVDNVEMVKSDFDIPV